MRSFKIAFTALLSFMLCQELSAQSYEGTFEKVLFKCPVENTVEGYLKTADGKKMEVVSYVDIADGEYVFVDDFSVSAL